jgi:hypothetical protein
MAPGDEWESGKNIGFNLGPAEVLNELFPTVSLDHIGMKDLFAFRIPWRNDHIIFQPSQQLVIQPGVLYVFFDNLFQ